MKRDHLKFVMDNWLLKNVAFKGIKRMEYIIAAIPLSETHDNVVDIQTFYEDFLEMRNRIETKFGRSHMIEAETQMMVMDMKESQRSMDR